jgi:hypothetical protein
MTSGTERGRTRSLTQLDICGEKITLENLSQGHADAKKLRQHHIFEYLLMQELVTLVRKDEIDMLDEVLSS